MTFILCALSSILVVIVFAFLTGQSLADEREFDNLISNITEMAEEKRMKINDICSEIKELDEKRTQGKWEVHCNDDNMCMSAIYITGEHGPDQDLIAGEIDHKNVIAIVLLQSPRLADDDNFEDNAAYIVSACNHAPALVEEVERMTAEKSESTRIISELREALEVYADHNMWVMVDERQRYTDRWNPVENGWEHAERTLDALKGGE